jgi:hypothetical protein
MQGSALACFQLAHMLSFNIDTTINDERYFTPALLVRSSGQLFAAQVASWLSSAPLHLYAVICPWQAGLSAIYAFEEKEGLHASERAEGHCSSYATATIHARLRSAALSGLRVGVRATMGSACQAPARGSVCWQTLRLADHRSLYHILGTMSKKVTKLAKPGKLTKQIWQDGRIGDLPAPESGPSSSSCCCRSRPESLPGPIWHPI